MGENDGLISIREAAKALGLSHSTLSRQIAAGKVRSHGGRVRIDEVRADRNANLRRGGRRKADAPDGRAAEHPCMWGGEWDDDPHERWRAAWVCWPVRIARVLAAETGADPEKLKHRLYWHVLQHLGAILRAEGYAR
jgi:excisionase family DNA binding protein